MMVRKIVNVALLGALVATAACNTVRGVGRDVSSAGDAVSKTAD